MSYNAYEVTDFVRDRIKPIIEDFIKKINYESNYAELDLTGMSVNPYQIWMILEDLGYESHSIEDNGWQLDFWMDFTKEGYPTITMAGTGITFEVKLYAHDE